MGNFLKSGKFRAILCILALLIGVMVYALTVGGYSISTVGFFKKLAAPFQKASNAISSRVEYVLDVYSEAQKNYEENRALRAQVADLEAQLSRYEALDAQLNQMEAYAGLREKYKNIQYSAPCEVLGYLTNDPFGAFMIDAGEADGLALYDPVVSETGLVGMITELARDTATVTTILSPDFTAAAYCGTTKDHGVVSGSVALAMEGRTRLSYLDTETQLETGKTILTSGENGKFPKGCVIGTVQEVGLDETGLSAYAAIEPAADLARLDLVAVIVDFEGKEALP